ncbi:hypothetical protein [Burkholderia cepacia]|uniref:hypothetical protein n=1 Tax=Burkholderia cepacia TaxID=292 RepID=UPI000AD2BA26|nr:hypothetical protein [Burkholderia cepacia]
MPAMHAHTLSALLEGVVRPDPDASLESAADACLVQRQYDDALSGYYQLDALIPRIATKIAFCEWMVGHYDHARALLTDLEAQRDPDGIGLLCELIRHDTDYKRRKADMEAIWPSLRGAASAESVPIIVAIARSQAWWPGDDEDRDQRHLDIERLLSLHPASQHIRLEVLAGMRRAGASAEEQYTVLSAWHHHSPMPRYLWELANVAAAAGKREEALEYLGKLEERERRSESPARRLLLEIELARCDIAVKQRVPDSLSHFDRLLSDSSLCSDDRTRVVRAALDAACKLAPERVSTFADEFLKALESTGYWFSVGPSELFNDAYPISGDGWDDYGHTWPCGDLMPHREILVATPQGRAGLFFRAAFAVADIDEQYDAVDERPALSTQFWDSVAILLGDFEGHESEFGGRLLSLHAAVRAHCHRPNWAMIGKDWIASEWAAAQNGHDYTHGRLTLEAAGGEADSVRIFASGVIKQLRDRPLPVPSSYDLVEGLVETLVEHKLSQELHQLMKIVADGDERPEVQFYLGLAAQRTRHQVAARSAYQRVLAQQPHHHSAIYNSLLLCTSTEDSPFLDQIAPLVAQYSEDEREEKQELVDALAKARQRCEDKEAVKWRGIRQALAAYPAFQDGEVGPADISLRAAVALLALMRCANAEPGDSELPPFDGCGMSFAPGPGGRRVLFDLLNTGLITVHPNTSTDAFVFEDGVVSGWHLGSIRWSLSPSCESLIERLRLLNGAIPESWRRDVHLLAFEIARGEVVEYLDFLAQERGWPEPRDTENVADLTRALVNELPVAQAFHLAYLGAMSASDYKQKYPVSRQQAADMLVRRTGLRLESVRNGRFPAKAYDRPWKLPRSAVSFALWGTILDMGDSGFTHRIADLVATL